MHLSLIHRLTYLAANPRVVPRVSVDNMVSAHYPCTSLSGTSDNKLEKTIEMDLHPPRAHINAIVYPLAIMAFS